jgi:CHAD domain-containing protein
MDPIRRTQTLFRKLSKLPAAILIKPTPENVHLLRTTTRRVETLLAAQEVSAHEPALPFAVAAGAETPAAAAALPSEGRQIEEDGPPARQHLLRQLKKLRRAAGKVRDVDVQLAALRTLHVHAKRDKAAVRRELEQVHLKRADKLARTIEKALDKGLEKRLKAVGEGMAAVAEFPATADRRPAAGGPLMAALRKFADLGEPFRQLTDANLHDFRMACKRIRYLAEMAGETPDAEAAIRQLKRIQDAVGEWHDWVNLAQTAEESLVNEHSPLLAAVRAGRRAKFNEALRITFDARKSLLEMYAAAARRPALASFEVAVMRRNSA